MQRYLSGIFFAFLMGILVSGCGGGDNILGDGDPVVVSGTVINADTFQPAKGVKVTLLGHEDRFSRTTGADGLFKITVPAGSKYLLVTDDPDSSTDNWLPLINFEYLDLTFKKARTEAQIHACPRKSGKTVPAPGKGTEAVFDNFLAKGDSKKMFAPTSFAASGGAVMFIVIQAPPVNSSFFLPDISVKVKEKDFAPVGYVDVTKFFNAQFQPDPALGPEILEGGGAATKTSAITQSAVSFGDADYSKDSVTVSLTDKNGKIDLGGPYDVPVRPGHLTFAVVGTLDGKVVRGQQVLCALNLSTVGCK